MTDYSQTSEKKLKELAEKEDLDALYEIGVRNEKKNDLNKAVKFYTFAAQLGHSKASAALGRLYKDGGKLDKAVQAYKRAYFSGEGSAACDLAVLLIDSDKEAALEVLTESAESGNSDSAEMLKKLTEEE